MFSQAFVILLGGGGGTSHASWGSSHGRVPSWTSDLAATPCYSYLVVITRNLFKLVHLRTYPHLSHWYWHLVVATETRTVGKLCVDRALIKAVRVREVLAPFRISHTCRTISKTVGRDILTNLRPVMRYSVYKSIFGTNSHMFIRTERK